MPGAGRVGVSDSGVLQAGSEVCEVEDGGEHSQRAVGFGGDRGRMGAGALRSYLSRHRVGAYRGARGAVGRKPRNRQNVGGGREGVVEGVLLLGREQRPAGGNSVKAQHGDSGRRVPRESHPGAGGRVHAEDVEEASATRGARNHVFVRRAVGGGGDAEPECDEPEPEPMACVVLVREGAAELGVEDVEGATREPGGGEEGIAGEGEGELVGAAGEVLSRGRGQGSEGGDVREGLHILRRTED